MASFSKALHDFSARGTRRRLPLGILCAAAGNAAIAGVNHEAVTHFHGDGVAAVLGIAIAYLFGVEAAAAGIAGYFVTAHFAWVVPGDFSVMTEAGKATGVFYAGSMAWAIWLANRARDFVNSAAMSRAIIEEEREILKLIAFNIPLGEILARLTGSVELLSPGVKCAVMALEADGQRLHPVAAPSLPADFVKALNDVEIGPSAVPCGAAAYLGRAVFSENIGEDPNWQCYRAIAAGSDPRAAWSFPIRGSGGSILGSFCVYASEPGLPGPGRQKIFERRSKFWTSGRNSSRESILEI